MQHPLFQTLGLGAHFGSNSLPHRLQKQVLSLVSTGDIRSFRRSGHQLSVNQSGITVIAVGSLYDGIAIGGGHIVAKLIAMADDGES